MKPGESKDPPISSQAERPPLGGARAERYMATILGRRGAQIVCQACGNACPRRGNVQKYCEPCAELRDRARKLKWANAHPQSSEITKKHQRTKRSRAADVGAARSELHRMGLGDVFDDETTMAWVRKVCVPFSYAVSKNHAYSVNAGGARFLRRETKGVRKAIAEAVWAATRDVKPVQAKLWIDIIVQKPNHRGDAVNVVDIVCDAIKDALPVDDRWYAIRRLDWQIVKNSPDFLIGIGQEATEDMRVCSYCGRVLPLCEFVKNRGMAGGRSRSCMDCHNESRRKPSKIVFDV